MKKNLRFLILVTLNLILVVINISFLLINIFKKNAKDIYQENIDAIVEIKASNVEQTSFGTGFFITNNLIATNYHVISNEEGLFSFLSYRFSYEEEYYSLVLKEYDEKKDIAILESNIKSPQVSICSNSHSSGEKIYVMGNGLNSGIGISEGVISLPKTIVDDRKVMQLDVTISDGNSGSPFFNEKGQVIAMISFRIKDDYFNIVYGIAYAIHIDEIVLLI